MLLKLTIILSLITITPAYAYIDPATGNAFFTLAITIVSAILFGVQYIYEHVFMVKGIFQKNKNKIPLLLYSEGNTYWPWFEPILDELEKRKIHTEFYTSSPDDNCFSRNYKYIHPTFIGRGNKAYAKMAFAKADIVLMTTPGLDVYQLKRSKYVKKYVHFYHGLGDHCGYRLFGADYYDTLLTDNEINGGYIRELEQKRNLPAKELVIVGNILLDEMCKKVKNLKIKKNTQRTILLSPSWGRESILYKYGEEIINKLLETDYDIIIRPHPQMKVDNPQLLEKLQNMFPSNGRLLWDFERDNLPSMAKSDLMISDFSSIIFEYAFTFSRPVITMNQNISLEQYDAGDLEQLTWKYTIYEKLGKKINKSDVEDLNSIIKELIDSNKEKEIKEIAKKYWTNQGKCVENIVNYIEKVRKYLAVKG